MAVGYGGFWLRVVATILDALIVGAVTIPLVFMLGVGSLTDERAFLSFMPMFNLLLIAGAWLYEAALTSSSYQATIGKLVVGLKVTDANGNRLSFLHATGRHFAKLLSQLTLFIGYLMVAFTERKQGLHDFIAGTLVVKNR